MMFVPGLIYRRRREIHDIYGGQGQGGITTPSGHKMILLFTGEAGATYGYQDAFRPDGVFGGILGLWLDRLWTRGREHLMLLRRPQSEVQNDFALGTKAAGKALLDAVEGEWGHAGLICENEDRPS